MDLAVGGGLHRLPAPCYACRPGTKRPMVSRPKTKPPRCACQAMPATSPWAALAGWIHYLAFDLFMGALVARRVMESGASRWWLHHSLARLDGELRSRGGQLILRRAPQSGLVVAERDLEYNVYRALAGQGLPIPGVYFLELDPKWLERPFFIMDLCPGKPGSPFVPTDPYDGHGTAIGEQYWSILGQLAAIDHRAVGLESLRNGNATFGFGSLELHRWEEILDDNEALIEPAVI